MKGNFHVRFGERGGETRRPQGRKVRPAPTLRTMHFGHYACEVFEAMYCDARDWGEVEIEDERIPSAILEYNLYGVDIDRRAVQLAALSLFMKARTMHPEVRVRQVNLVAADATLPDSEVKKKFLARYAHNKRVQQAFAQVLEDMDQVAQVGSLLRVEERLRELLTRAGHAAVMGELDARRQRELPGFEPPVRQMGLAEVVEEDQAAEWTPHYTLQELRDDLRAFAREALQEHDLNAQLFATEADKAVRLLDVLMGEYDVVVMNPPYGDATPKAQQIIKSTYPWSYRNLYASFIEKGLSLLSERGYLGALTERMYLVQYSFREFRAKVLQEKHTVLGFLDLWYDVLDGAMNRTTATLFTNEQHADDDAFFALNLDCDNKRHRLEEALQASGFTWLSHDIPKHMPYGMYTYQIPISMFELAASGRTISSEFSAAKSNTFQIRATA
jgi:hypothetical protein